MIDWRQKFDEWSQGPSQAEQLRLDRIVKDISDTLRSNNVLRERNLIVTTQGSYRNRVNVKRNSDVDIASLHDGVFFYDVPPHKTIKDYVDPFTAATYDYARYKNEVEAALVQKYGRENVVRGNKAIDVNSRDYDVDADVVPCFNFRDYTDPRGLFHGTALRADDGQLCTNFPEQQYDNGVNKHRTTKRRFKRQVRIQKNIRNFMDEKGIRSAVPIKSFLIESLCWNAPDHCYGHNHYFDDFEKVLQWAYLKTETDMEAGSLFEVNNIKRLFGNHNKWTRNEVRQFLTDLWNITH